MHINRYISSSSANLQARSRCSPAIHSAFSQQYSRHPPETTGSCTETDPSPRNAQNIIYELFDESQIPNKQRVSQVARRSVSKTNLVAVTAAPISRMAGYITPKYTTKRVDHINNRNRSHSLQIYMHSHRYISSSSANTQARSR